MRLTWAQRRSRLRAGRLGRLFLGACALVYGAAVLARRWAYDLGLFKRRKLSAKVICIGNLTAGGAGKTPAVLLAAHTLRQRNHNVAILSRGYGRSRKDEDITVLLEDSAPAWGECGDEPWMMRNALLGQGVPILVSPNRLLAGHKAITYYHAKVIVLDDGFQHFKLKRNLDIVMVNATDPFGGRRLLPLGDLREPLSALWRAHMVVLTHVDLASTSQIKAIKEEILAINPRLPVLESIHKTDFLLDVKKEKKHPTSLLKDREVTVVSAIADSSSFEEHVARTGARVAQKWRYPDHHPYTAEELRAIETLRRRAVPAGAGAGRGQAEAAAEVPIVTTFKDLPRLPSGWENILTGDVYAVAIKLEIVKGKNLWVDALCHGL